MLDRVSKDFLVYSGDDPTAVELMLMGGKGNISVTANVAPRAMSELCAAAMAGDAETARAINERLMPLHRALFWEANPIPVKWALHEMGLMGNGIRLPLTGSARATENRSVRRCAKPACWLNNKGIRMKRLAGLSTLALISATSGCGWLWGDDGYFRDRGSDYLSARQTAPMQVAVDGGTRPLDPLLPIPRGG